MRYRAEDVRSIVIAGEEYGTGSARDWAAKATRLLGVRAVIAASFERIHRSNLVGMGVLPCQFPAARNAATLRPFRHGDFRSGRIGRTCEARPISDIGRASREWRSRRGSVDASPRYANGSRICAPRQHHVVRAQRVDEAPARAGRLRPRVAACRGGILQARISHYRLNSLGVTQNIQRPMPNDCHFSDRLV